MKWRLRASKGGCTAVRDSDRQRVGKRGGGVIGVPLSESDSASPSESETGRGGGESVEQSTRESARARNRERERKRETKRPQGRFVCGAAAKSAKGGEGGKDRKRGICVSNGKY